MAKSYCRICNKELELRDSWDFNYYTGDACCSFKCATIAKNDFFLATSIICIILTILSLTFPDIVDYRFAGPSFLVFIVLLPFTIYSRINGTEKKLYERRERVRRRFTKKTNF